MFEEMLVWDHISSWTIKRGEYSNFLHFPDVFDQIYLLYKYKWTENGHI